MTAPKLHDYRVWYWPRGAQRSVRISVRNLAEALTVLATLETVTAFETVQGVRREIGFDAGVSRWEPDHTGGRWWPVDQWELDAVAEVLAA